MGCSVNQINGKPTNEAGRGCVWCARGFPGLQRGHAAPRHLAAHLLDRVVSRGPADTGTCATLARQSMPDRAGRNRLSRIAMARRSLEAARI